MPIIYYSFSSRTCSIFPNHQSRRNEPEEPFKTDVETKKLFVALKAFAAKLLVDSLFSEGILENKSKKMKTLTALKDVQKTYALAMVYRMEEDEKYSGKAIEFMKA